MLIRPQTQKANMKNKAEYIITVTWPNDNTDDIDTWLEDPLGGVVWFRRLEKNFAHIDRDDLGYINDTIIMPDGLVVKCPRNQELTTIRGFIPGEWTLNVHAYTKREKEPTHVIATIDKINPSFSTVFYKDITLTSQWQEETATRFTMNANGDIMMFDPTFKPLVIIKETASP